MKIQTISVVLMSLVSALTFMSLATAQQSKAAGDTCSPPCPANQKCISQWGTCAPMAIAPPPGAMIVDPNTHTFDPNTETCVAISHSDKVGCAKKQ